MLKFASVIDIIPHIQYLVSRHDCVILPGWGAFVARHVEAHAADGILMPPCRVIGFNPDVNHNDAMLATSVARREKIPYDSAAAAVTNAVSRLHELYDTAGILLIPRVGALRKGSDGLTLFEAVAPATSIASCAYDGLPQVELPASQAETEPREEASAPRPTPWSAQRKATGIAAAAAVLIGLGIVLSTPITVERTVNYASMPAPTVTAARSAEIPAPTIAAVTPDPTEASAQEAEPAAAASATQTAESAPTAETASKAIDAPEATVSEASQPAAAAPAATEYYLVVSSHRTAAEARRYIAAHPGEGLQLLTVGKYCRVYAAKAADYTAATAPTRRQDFAAKHPDAWVFIHRPGR